MDQPGLYDVQEAKKDGFDLDEICPKLPEEVKKNVITRLPEELYMQVSRAYRDEGKSKKRKRSTSGDDLLEMNVDKQVPSAAVGDSTKPVSGWNFFRMLIPAMCDDFERREMKKRLEKSDAKVDIYRGVGVDVVTVLAKEDTSDSTSPAVNGLVTLQECFVEKQTYFPPGSAFRLTRLLVPAAQARELIRSNIFGIIAKKTGCFFYIYFTDNVSILSVGDVIIELQGLARRLTNAVREIAMYLRQFPVDESLISAFESHMDLTHLGSPPKNDISTSEGKSDWKFAVVKAERPEEFQHFTTLSLSDVEKLIGENGENVERLQKSTRASIFVAPILPDDIILAADTQSASDVQFSIYGDTDADVEDAEREMEKIIGEEGVFAHAFETFFSLPSLPVEGEDWF